MDNVHFSTFIFILYPLNSCKRECKVWDLTTFWTTVWIKKVEEGEVPLGAITIQLYKVRNKKEQSLGRHLMWNRNPPTHNCVQTECGSEKRSKILGGLERMAQMVKLKIPLRLWYQINLRTLSVHS